MARVRGMHGERLESAVGRVESVVVRVLRGIARTVASLVGGSPSPSALSEDDFQVIRRDWGAAVTVEIVPAVAEVYRESAEVLAKEFANTGRPVDVVSLEAPSAADFLDAATNRLVAVSDTLWEVARRELADGVRAGDGIEELAARLQVAGGFGEARARMIARTEVVAASNSASLAQALRLGDPSISKEWLATTEAGGLVCDERTRDAHCDAHEQVQPLAEPFAVGDTWLMYPGQPIGPADQVVNCRCGIGYVVEDKVEDPLTAAAEVHTGAMIALRPSVADAERLTVEGGEPAEQLHVTLFYLGDAAAFDDDTRAALINAIRSMVERREIPAVTAKGFGLSVFNPDGDEPCWVLDIGDEPNAGDSRLDLVRGAVEEAWHDGGVQVDLPEQHTPWRPHLTLIYDDDLGWAERLAERVGPIVFDNIWVAFGGDNTDIPLTPVAPTIAAAEPGDNQTEPEHVGGVDLADSGMQVDAWRDGTFSITDPGGGGFWLDEDEANDLIDALNQVRSGGPAVTLDVGAGGLEVAWDDAGQVLLVPQNEAGGWTLSDDDAYDLSYWLAYWLDKGGYYDDGAEAAQDPAEPLTAARRPWDPLKHPRGPDGKFIGKGIVGRVSGATTSKATRRADPPASLPSRPVTSDDPRRAELSRLRVAELRTLLRERGGKPGRARRADLIAMIADADADADNPGEPEADPLTGDDARAAVPVSIATQARGELSPAEQDALIQYKGAGYETANGRLREFGGTLPDLPRFSILAQRIRDTDAALAKSPLAADIRVDRGIADGRTVFGDAWDRNLTGAEWTEHGYMSTTTSDRLAGFFSGDEQGGGARLRMLVPAGTEAVELSGAAGESELLLQRGLRVRVVSDTGPGPGRELTVEVFADDRTGADGAEPGGGFTDRGTGPDDDGLPGRGDVSSFGSGAEPAARPARVEGDTSGDDGEVPEPLEGWAAYFTAEMEAAFQSRMPPQLQAHWIKKLRLGTEGSFRRCVRELKEYFPEDTEGLCANLYHTATGRWPGRKKDNAEAAGDEATNALAVDAPHDGPVTVEVEGEPSAPDPLAALPGEHFHTRVLEGVSTGMRQFAPGAITWRTPPFAYHWQWKSSAHNGLPETIQVGLVTRALRDDPNVHFWGRLDLRSPEGLDYARRLVEGWARWTSVGGDESIKDKYIDVEYVLADEPNPGTPLEDPEIDLMTFNQYRVAEISGVSVPALADATVEPTQELIDTLIAMGVIDPAGVVGEPPSVEEIQEDEEDEVADFAAVQAQDMPATEETPVVGGTPSDLDSHPPVVVVAAGHTITLPEAPPAAWFDEPADDELPPYGSVRVDANGRLIGLLAPAQVNHRSFPGKRVKVPMGNVDYSGWMNKSWQVDDGRSINVGVITMDCGHASTNPGDWSYSNRREHYDNTCSIAAHARAYEKPGIGVALAGAIAPWLDAEGFGKLLSSDLSGDWPPHPDRPGWRDFIAALAVPVGGFANRARLRVAEGALVAAAVPVQFNDMEIPMEIMEETPPLAEGTPVRVLDLRDPEVTEGEIAVVHPGPVYALLVPGRNEPVRWYVAEELEPADAMLPVEEETPVEELVASAGPDLRPALERVAKSVGLDAVTRMEVLRNRVHSAT